LTLSITAAGEVNGSHTNGCIYNGRVAVPDPARNMARLNVEISNCSERFGNSSRWNGNYEGLAVLQETDGGASTPARRSLYQSLVGPLWLGDQELVR
jgi:hypothetical protein